MNSTKKIVVIGIMAVVVMLVIAMIIKPPSSKKIDDSGFVLISRIDLQPGTFIKVNDYLSFVDMGSKSPQQFWMRKKDIDAMQFEGSVVRSLIKAGEPLDKTKFVTPKEGGFMSAVLYPGMRAISVGVDVVSANAGFIFPGDKVDLLLTHELEAMNNRRSHITETVTENIRVLAIDQQVNNVDNKAMVPKTVTLEVTPKQAEEILVAQQIGKLSLILRSQINGVEEIRTEKSFTKDSDVSKVLLESSPPVDSSASVTVVRGKGSSQ